jgi:hypothetical protein
VFAVVVQRHNQQRFDNRPGIIWTYHKYSAAADSDKIGMGNRKLAAISQSHGERLKGLSVQSFTNTLQVHLLLLVILSTGAAQTPAATAQHIDVEQGLEVLYFVYYSGDCRERQEKFSISYLRFTIFNLRLLPGLF